MSRNIALETAIAEVTNLGDLSIRLKITIQDIDFTPVRKEAEKAVSEGLRLGLDTQSVAAIMSFASSGISIGKFLNEEVQGALENLDFSELRNSLSGIAPALKAASEGIGKVFASIGIAAVDAATKVGRAAISLAQSVKLKIKSSALWVKTNTLKAASFVKLKAAMMATAIKTKALALATKFATAAQKIFNLVMKANPVGLVIAAIAALVAGLALFFTQTETGRGVWQQLTAAFSLAGDAISGLIAWFSNIVARIRESETVMRALKIVFAALKGPIGAVGLAIASLVAPFVNARAAQLRT